MHVGCARVGGVVVCRECFQDERKHASAYNAAANPLEQAASARRMPLSFMAATTDRHPDVDSDPTGWTLGDLGRGGVLDNDMMMDVVSFVCADVDNP